MTTTTRILTAEQFWNMPDHGGRHELIDGELHAMSPANSRHGYLAFRIGALLDRMMAARKAGVFFAAETGFIVSHNPDTVLAPDVAFVFASRIPTGGIPDRYFDGAPDFAVEVLSPTDSAQDVEVKARKFLDAGTRLIWIVNPKTQEVTVYQPGPTTKYLKKTDQISGEDVFPGLIIGVSELFS